MLLASMDVPRQAEPFGVAGNCQDAAGCSALLALLRYQRGVFTVTVEKKGKQFPVSRELGFLFTYL